MYVVVDSVLPAGSTTAPRLVRFTPIDPVLAPVTPAMLTVTVHVALGAAPEGTTPVIVGVPVIPLAASPKFDTATPDTGSENVAVQVNGPAFTACEAPARLIESSVGRVLSRMTVCGGAVPTLVARSACVADTIRVPLVVQEVANVHDPAVQFTVPAVVPFTSTVTGARSPDRAPHVPPTDVMLFLVEYGKVRTARSPA